MGRCDRSSGECLCEAGFTGAACNRMTCPGGPVPTSTDEEACSGRGKCYDLHTLASLSGVNGEVAGFTYGLTPNFAPTWDANKVFGCYCDSGYGGYDCSLTLCPTGHNPELDGAAYTDEIQLVGCTDVDMGGFVSLTFRQQSTISLSPTAKAVDVQEALEALSTIGKVSVVLMDPSGVDSLCSSTGSEMLITFLTEHGDVPMMTAIDIDIDTVTITEYTKGTKENAICSNKGICDTQTGLCSCFPGYGSSDGQGRMGTKNDCGYVNPITLPQGN